MSFENRSAVDYFGGALSVQATLSDTSMKSAAFVPLPSDYAVAGKYLPVTLYDDVLKVYEIVWITGHSSGSDTVTVVRGKEGTIPRAWPSSSQFVSAPTSRDVLGARTNAALPTDPFLGERAARTDKGDVVERTKQGWAPSAGVGFAADQGSNIHGSHPPDGYVLQMRCGAFNGTTDGSGLVVLSYASPFPTATMSIAITSNVFAAPGMFVAPVVRANGADVFVCTNWTGGRLANTAVAFHYQAVGW